MKPGKKPITVAIYQAETGLELRIHHGADQRPGRFVAVTRRRELPLTLRADERMALLVEHEWVRVGDPCPSTGRAGQSSG